MAERYRTIVADPPWEYGEGFALGPGHPERNLRPRSECLTVAPLPYGAMSVKAIAELPVGEFADANCRLFLWTTNRYLPDSFAILPRWGFVYRQTLVWHKPDMNLPAAVAPNSAEFLVVASRGKPERRTPLSSAVITKPRSMGKVANHSTKPECFLDYIEQVSPGPYLELFARRARFGWDYWGDESLQTVELAP